MSATNPMKIVELSWIGEAGSDTVARIDTLQRILRHDDERGVPPSL